jgi:hypothetical protein
MKAKAILILLVVTLAALVCLHLDDFGLSNSTAEASLLPERSGRTYSEVATLTITVDGLTKRLFERKIRECTPWGFDDEGVLLGISTKELFECVYESLSEKVKEQFDRDEAYAMTDIVLEDMVERGHIVYEDGQWRLRNTGEYPMRHWTE